MPAISQIHIDQALTNISVMYRNASYVADEVFPILPVSKRSNKYFLKKPGKPIVYRRARDCLWEVRDYFQAFAGF